MALFDSILAAIESPDREASSDQLSGILGTVSQLAGSANASPDALETALSVVGKYAKSSLQQQRDTQGAASAQATVNRFSGTQPNSQAIDALFAAPQVEQMVGEIEARTGLESGTVRNLLPMAVPVVLQMLKTGNDKAGAQASGNSVLDTFLDSDGDGDVDVADAMRMASRYLGR